MVVVVFERPIKGEEKKKEVKVAMGRPPCCDKVGIKKGPWTPEEDIILVSYIQEHGPGNWRSVPINTGLLRCSKSCRLRWTNYLRPGIKRGNFTPHEEGMIIHLQALLGNKWAAIASYLPQRTDNDIKNYWNTHLKKKLKKFQSALDPQMAQQTDSTTASQFLLKSFNERKSSNFPSSQTESGLRLNHGSSTYASSTENIARLLEGWMRSSPKCSTNSSLIIKENWNQNRCLDNNNNGSIGNTSSAATSSLQGYRPKTEQDGGGRGELISNEEFESILSFDHQNMNSTNVAGEKSSPDSSSRANFQSASADYHHDQGKVNNSSMVLEKKQKLDNSNNPPFSFLENWLLEETAGHEVEDMNEMMELPSIF